MEAAKSISDQAPKELLEYFGMLEHNERMLQLRDVVTRTLEMTGYEIARKQTAEEAISLFLMSNELSNSFDNLIRSRSDF